MVPLDTAMRSKHQAFCSFEYDVRPRQQTPRAAVYAFPVSGVLASDQTWIQSVAVGQSKIFLSVPGGAGWQHVSSCQAQLLISEVISWAGAACSEVAPSIRSRQCCNPVKYHSVLVFELPLAAGIDLTECKYGSLTFFFFGKIPCH